MLLPLGQSARDRSWDICLVAGVRSLLKSIGVTAGGVSL